MFDSDFYTAVLPDLIKDVCPAGLSDVPIVELRIADGTILDVCHILYLGPSWLAAACYPSLGPSSQMITEFVRYEFITRVTVSLQEIQTRKLGFDLLKSSTARLIGPQ